MEVIIEAFNKIKICKSTLIHNYRMECQSIPSNKIIIVLNHQRINNSKINKWESISMETRDKFNKILKVNKNKIRIIVI